MTPPTTAVVLMPAMIFPRVVIFWNENVWAESDGEEGTVSVDIEIADESGTD